MSKYVKRDKPKFNLKRCAKCKYHGTGAGYPVRPGMNPIFCNYAGVTDQTCLTVKDRQTIDRRGEDYDHCKLYEAGKPARTDLQII